MGLFDAYYDPQTSTGGSLIDRLLSQLSTQGQYQPSQGFADAPTYAGQSLPQIMGSMAPPMVDPNQQPTVQQKPLNPAEQQMMSLLSRPGYQPGLPDTGAPQDAGAPAPAAPPMAAPSRPQNAAIAVGSYLMPRLGSGFTDNTQPAMSPQQYSALPVSQRVPQDTQAPQAPAPQSAAQPSFLPSSGGGFGGAARGALANMHGGPLGLLAGAIAGGMGMGLGTPREQQRQALTQNYNALIAAGIPAEKALLATINPEASKIIISEALSNKQKYAKIGQDGLGREQYGFVDETNQTVNGKPISQQPQDATGGGLGNMDLSGKEYLASIPTAQRVTVQGMVDGTIAPPSSFALAKPYWQNMIAAAKNVDPTFDSTQWGGRVAGVKDFSSGKSSEMVRSANQTLGHIGDLIGKMDALNNGSYPMANAVGNWANTAQGGAATTGFHQTAHAVADELSKVFKGAGISDSEIRQWESDLSPNMSPAQQREAVTTAMSLLNHSLSALEEKRLNSIGPAAAEKAGPLLKPDALAAVDRINKWAAGGGSGAPAAPAPPASGTAGPRKVNWSVVQ